MTQDNYNYRTAPLFLRDQFTQAGKYGIPIIPKAKFAESDFDELRLIGFDKIKSDAGKHPNRMVHFFQYDYKFKRVWEKPDEDLGDLKSYRAVLSPDFSMYTEMPEAMLLYNVFRNRWCGAYFASQGLRVIPTVNFGLPGSFDFCFEGIPKGSAVALSTYMVQEKEGREAQKDFFMAGYNEMIRRIEPETILCYHELFPEMEGNIVYINYELSSWKHMDDDVAGDQAAKSVRISAGSHRVVKRGGYVLREEAPSEITGYRIEKYGGYVLLLGAGSAYGGQWTPKKEEDKRYLGEAGDINHWEGTYKKDIKIGEDGRATLERHYTDHHRPDKHTNPHDHVIKWKEDGSPAPQSPVNYWNGDIPQFKQFEEVYMHRYFKAGIPHDNNFVSIADFQDCMRRHGEVQFTYREKDYGIFPYMHPTQEHGDQYLIWQTGDYDSETYYDDSEGLLEHMIEGKKLREIITEVEVFDRTV